MSKISEKRTIMKGVDTTENGWNKKTFSDDCYDVGWNLI